MNAYLAKPIDFNMLFETLQQVLSSHARAEEQRPVPKAPPVTKHPPLPLSSLIRMPESWQHDPEKQSHYLRLLKTDIQHGFARIEQAIHNNKADTISKAAHQLKGAIGQLRSPQLNELVHRIERAANARKVRDVSPPFMQLKQAIAITWEQTGSGPEL